MIVNGRAEMSAKLSSAAERQLQLRYDVAVEVAKRQLLPLWTGRAVNFVTSGSGWPFFHSPRGKSGMSHGLNR